MDGFDIVPARKIAATVTGLYVADGEGFVTRAVEQLAVAFEGIPGDVHAGVTRGSTSREPWYPRGTEIRNDRQFTIVAADELAEVASAMEIEEIAPEWIGGNLLIDGVDRLSMLPSGTRLFFANGATLAVEAQNGPCRIAGQSIGEHYPERTGLDLLFPKAAERRRGLVAWVEKPGSIDLGERLEVRVPEHWAYR